MHGHGAVGGAAEQSLVAHRRHQQGPVGQPAEAGRLALHGDELLLAAIRGHGEDGAAVEVRHPPAALPPARTFEVGAAFEQGGELSVRHARTVAGRGSATLAGAMTETTSPPRRAGPRTVDVYEPATVEAKWRRIWEERGDYRTDLDSPDRPFYNLSMFPYPSAEGLHVGHMVPYSGIDIYGRWRRLHGDNVFEPMGFDAFGIHSENYALKIGEHPAIVMRRAVANFRENQLKKIGSMFDWEHQVNTADPSYYRWTQWVFLQLFKHGLAEWREGAVNWCPSCLTVLADEQ